MDVELKSITRITDVEHRGAGFDNPGFVAKENKETNYKHCHGTYAEKENSNSNGDTVFTSDKDNTNNANTDSEDDLDDVADLGVCTNFVTVVQMTVLEFVVANKKRIVTGVLVFLFLAYMVYFILSLKHHFGDEASIRLLVFTIFGVLIIAFNIGWPVVYPHVKTCIQSTRNRKVRRLIRWVLYILSSVGMVTTLIVMVALQTPENLISLAGLAAFIFLVYITSYNPAKVNWHPVYWGFCLQFFFAVIILRTRWGFLCFDWLGSRVTEFLAYSDEGAAFVFGDTYSMHFFAFSVLPMIVFFSSIISTLYYLGVMQAIVRVLGRFLAFCLGTSPAESLNAAANIFVGMNEAPLLIRPFIAKMTKSELHAVMVGGFATIAGSVLGAYIAFGVPADHLLAASVMSAPASLAISKLTYPETEKQIISDDDYTHIENTSDQNILEAASSGASASIALVANVAVNVMAFLSILKFLNATLIWFGERVGVEGVTFQFLCSYVLYPVALFMGTEPRDCRRVAELVGVKTFTNEFIAYGELKVLLDNHKTYLNYSNYYDVHNASNIQQHSNDILLTHWNITLKNGFMTTRSEVIATYALCGFSNFGSMGILLGSLSAIAPDRKQDMASIVLRAMIAGNVACFFTACIAGLFFEEFK